MAHLYRGCAAALAGILLATAAAAAEPARYRNFELAIYCRVDDVRRMAEGDWLARHFDLLQRQLKVSKVYLETHRSRVTNDRETMLKVKTLLRGARREDRGRHHAASRTRAASSSSSATPIPPTASTSRTRCASPRRCSTS